MLKKIVCGIFSALMLASMSASALATDTPATNIEKAIAVTSNVENAENTASPKWNPFCTHDTYEAIENSRIEYCSGKGQHVYLETFYKCTGFGCDEFYRESWYSCGMCFDGDTV